MSGKKANNDKELKELLLAIKDDIKEEIQVISKKSDDIIAQLQHISTRVDELEIKHNSLEKKYDSLDKKIDDNIHKFQPKTAKIEAQIRDLSNKLAALDALNRRTNLLIDGLKYEANENCDKKLRDLFRDQLKISAADNILIEKCHRIGGKKPQSILCSFASYKDRQMVWSEKNKLKGSTITFREDFSPEISERRKILYPFMMKARDSGHFATLKNDKLKVDDALYSIEDLDKLPQDCDPRHSATKTVDNITAFYTANSPLSNFYKCNLVIDGNYFPTVEHYLQMHKALFAEQPEMATNIRLSKSALDAKRLGDSLTVNENEWLPVAQEKVRKAVTLKFTSNEYLKNYILSTGNNTLAEATYNKTWGIGLKLTDENIAKKSEWSGRNLQGEILMSVRAAIFANK